jgi:hypothetical protein
MTQRHNNTQKQIQLSRYKRYKKNREAERNKILDRIKELEESYKK